jgi:serine phosphatase RsbU (regulator of sigma subunit)/CHASE1-domain containing sensor protein
MDGRRLLSVGLVAGLLAATGLASALVLRSERAEERRVARSVADQAAAATASTLRLAAISVRGAEVLLTPEGSLPAHRFTAFGDVAADEGIITLVGWARRVPASERAAFETEVGRPILTSAPDGTLRRQGDAAEYLPVEKVHPNAHEPRRALGLDQYGDPRRAAAARWSRDAGSPRMSAPIVLVGNLQPALLVYQAAYVPGRRTDSVAARDAAFAGAVVGALSVDRLTEVVSAQLPDGAGFRITDGDEVVVSGPVDADATRSVSALGRRWDVAVTTDEASSRSLALVIGVGGTILALLAGAVVALSRRRERSLEAARELAERFAERDALLLDVGAAVDAAGSMDERTQAVAALLADRFADMCAIDHLDAAGNLVRIGRAAHDPRRAEILRQVAPPSLESRQAAVVRRGEPLLLAELDERLVGEISASPEHDAARRALGMRSAMVVPLAAQGVVTGAITLAIAGEDGRRFGPDDLNFGTQLAQHLSLALDNARLYESEHEIATTLQQALLPPRLPAPPGVEVGARYRPMGTGVMVGGDFYDLFRGAEGWVAVVGDVRGKGPRAAAVTALVRHTLRARAATDGIVSALATVNDALRDEQDDELFCSVAAIEFTLDGDPPASGHLRAVAAGQAPPLVLRADRTLDTLPAAGRLLGPFEDPCLEAADSRLHPGDTILLYTDGLAEARRGREQFGEARLHEAVRTAPRGSLAGLLTSIELEAVTFAGGRPQDDIALVALRLPLPGGGTGQDWMGARG